MNGFHTLNARDAWYLRQIFSMSDNDPENFRAAVQGDGEFVRSQLKAAGVDYHDLKNALIPSADGHQVAFMFNWVGHPGPNYAVSFMTDVVRLLRKSLKTSVLSGDLLAPNGNPVPETALDSELVKPRGQETGTVHWQNQYCIFFSNLRPNDVIDIHQGLSANNRYGGYIDVTFGGSVRDYLSRTLAPKWVIAGGRVILDHGGDEPWVSNEDPMWHDLPSLGFEVVSTIDAIYSTYLSYKIESLSSPDARLDRILTLAAVTGRLIDVDNLAIVVDPPKLHSYLLKNEPKLRLMTSIGLQEVDALGLETVIREKLRRNYIYDLKFASDGTPVFAVTAEFEKPAGGRARRLLALKYDEASERIALVSMY